MQMISPMKRSTQKTIIIEHNQTLKLHRNLSFEEYFSSYSREHDGRVRVATYSFNDGAFENIYRLMPFSIFYISEKHRSSAIKLLRRFPHYLVYTVRGLHTKCIHYEKSGATLLGSQNLFSPSSTFEELCCEIIVDDSMKASFLSLAFDFNDSRFLRVAYAPEDINYYGDEAPGVKGRPYLPCHLEIEYWAKLSERDVTSANRLHHYIYLILEFSTERSKAFLAFDRHYHFCGELEASTFKTLLDANEVRYQKDVFLPQGTKLLSTSPFKDNIAKYHPICLESQATGAYYFD